jgi:hypothetical protein
MVSQYSWYETSTQLQPNIHNVQHKYVAERKAPERVKCKHCEDWDYYKLYINTKTSSLYLKSNKYRLNYNEQRVNAAYSENRMKYITTPCSENRIFCDVQVGDRRAATVLEKINLYVHKEMKV